MQDDQRQLPADVIAVVFLGLERSADGIERRSHGSDDFGLVVAITRDPFQHRTALVVAKSMRSLKVENRWEWSKLTTLKKSSAGRLPSGTEAETVKSVP
jgi:hypothetical protein